MKCSHLVFVLDGAANMLAATGQEPQNRTDLLLTKAGSRIKTKEKANKINQSEATPERPRV